MGNNKEPQIVNVDGTEYDVNNFTDQQRLLLDHCVDLERKLASCRFQLDQLNVGKDAFLTLLKQSLKTESKEAQPSNMEVL
jgi:hypothetical protein